MVRHSKFPSTKKVETFIEITKEAMTDEEFNRTVAFLSDKVKVEVIGRVMYFTFDNTTQRDVFLKYMKPQLSVKYLVYDKAT
jgi:uncharacterized protein (DUF1697 family)